MSTSDDPHDRRAFLRRASRDAVTGAARLAGLSAAVGRSVSAAATAAADELRQELGEGRPGPDAVVPAEIPIGPASNQAPSTAAPRLSPDQEAFLSGHRSAAIAVNDLAGAPSLTPSWFHWDGAAFRLPARMFGAKAANIARDPRVSLMMERPDPSAWVMVTGEAAIVAGPDAVKEARGLLAKYRPGIDPAVAWAEIDTAGDLAIIVVRPSRFVWQ
jgi:nitroimidazol reductase NimA-like FMN-containing flavoprotein (pyridoxamine 5'-phosphate oxidase superfamily)